MKTLIINCLKILFEMKNKNLLCYLSFGLLATLLYACGSQPSDKAAQLAALKEQKTKIETEITALEKELGNKNTPQRIKTVGISELTTSTFRHYIDLQGRVDAEENVPATAKIAGALTQVLIKNGDVVKKGQLLAVIDDGVMLKQLAELENQLKTAEDIYNRQKGLWDQKIGTEVQFIQAKAQKEGLERSIATLKEGWGQTRIYSPISGSVDLVALKTGQAISPGMPLCNIINLGRLKIVGEVTEAYVSKVRKGDPVVVFFPDLNKEITTKISYVSNTINTNTRTFTVECNLPAERGYRANMVAVLKIIDYQNPKAIVVPVNLIQTAEDGEFVMVADKTGDKTATARKTPVKQGYNYSGMVEIVSGLKNGDFAISTGFQDVNNGETIAF